jgi:hypothetical protein
MGSRRSLRDRLNCQHRWATIEKEHPLKKSAVVLFALGALVVVSPRAKAETTAPAFGVQAKPLNMGGEHRSKLREEIRLHEQRAHEIEPILARDGQARHDVEVDWMVLERHARELHARANDFRGYAAEVSGRAQSDMQTFASELDTFATHDEENARWQHEVADRLERAIQSETAIRDWHLKMAQRLRDWLAANGG